MAPLVQPGIHARLPPRDVQEVWGHDPPTDVSTHCFILRRLPGKVSDKLLYSSVSSCASKFRVLLACLRFLAHCPRPRCMVTKQQVQDMGTKRDTNRRANLHVDTPAVQHSIEKARELIFKKGRSVKSDAVEGLLKPTSLVPTRVSTVALVVSPADPTVSHRTPSLFGSPTPDSTTTQCSAGTSCMNSNSGYGKTSSSTSCVASWRWAEIPSTISTRGVYGACASVVIVWRQLNAHCSSIQIQNDSYIWEGLHKKVWD